MPSLDFLFSTAILILLNPLKTGKKRLFIRSYTHSKGPKNSPFSTEVEELAASLKNR